MSVQPSPSQGSGTTNTDANANVNVDVDGLSKAARFKLRVQQQRLRVKKRQYDRRLKCIVTLWRRIHVEFRMPPHTVGALRVTCKAASRALDAMVPIEYVLLCMSVALQMKM